MLNVTHLRQEHHQMRRLIGILAREAAALRRGTDADLALMADVLRYLTEHPDRYHHPVEDLALWRLAERGKLPRPAADELDFEHRAVRHHGGQVLQLLERALTDALTPRAWIAMAVEQYAAALNAHMTHEERELLPLLERELSPADWDEIARASAPPADPLFGEHVDSRFGYLRASIAERATCGCDVDVAASGRGSASRARAEDAQADDGVAARPRVLTPAGEKPRRAPA
jgi:hemerythrin-like domain-containing protein